MCKENQRELICREERINELYREKPRENMTPERWTVLRKKLVADGFPGSSLS